MKYAASVLDELTVGLASQEETCSVDAKSCWSFCAMQAASALQRGEEEGGRR